MPTVPQYDGLQVGASGASGARFTAPAPSVDPGRALSQAGQGALGVGGELGRIAADIQARTNQTRVADAMNQMVAARLDVQVEALSLKGRNALERPGGESLPVEFDGKLGKAAEEIAGKLGNDAQRGVFMQQVQQMRGQFRATMTDHVIGQQREFEKETRASERAVAVQQGGLLWGDATMRAQSIGAIRASVLQEAQADGMTDPKVVEARMAEAMSPLHAAVIQGMIDGDRADLAEAYYNENSATMNLQVRATASRLINAGAQDRKVREKIEEVMAAAGGDYKQAVTLLREDGDATIAKLAEDELYQRETQDRIVRNQAEQEALGSVQLAIEEGRSMGAIRKTPAFDLLSDGMKAKAESYHDARQRELRAEARAARAEAQGRAIETNLADYDTLSNLAAAGKLKDVDLSRYQLSRAHMQKFIDERAAQRNPKADAPDTAKWAAGELAAFKSQLPDDAEKRGAFQIAADGELQARIAAGEKNTPELRRRILEDLSLKREGEGLFSRDKFGFQLTPSERRARAVEVPDVDRRMIEEALRAKNKPVTDEAVQRLYRQEKGF